MNKDDIDIANLCRQIEGLYRSWTEITAEAGDRAVKAAKEIVKGEDIRELTTADLAIMLLINSIYEAATSMGDDGITAWNTAKSLAGTVIKAGAGEDDAL